MRLPFTISFLLTMMLLSCEDRETNLTPMQATPTTPAIQSPWLEDVASSGNLLFTWESGHHEAFLMPEIIGGGAALLDYDLDGDMDVYFVQGGDVTTQWPRGNPEAAKNRLFRNDGEMSFTDVTQETRAGDTGYGIGVAVGDIDNDGDADLYITNVGRNTLLRNDKGTFVDITDASNTGHGGWGASAAFFDADLDGDLDLYATNYLDWTPHTELTCYSAHGGEDYCSPKNYLMPAKDVFYVNKGDGTFEDATTAAGFDATSGTGLGVSHADWSGDGRPDLFVANDGMPDMLWISQPDGTWREVGTEWGCALDNEGIAKAGMGTDTTDLDDDGDFDIIVCNLTGESDSVFRNDGQYFVDITGRTGIRAKTKHATRFGLGWRDFDNDGWLDLYEANGAVTRESVTAGDDPYAQEDMLLSGGPNLQFNRVMPRGGTTQPIALTSRAAAFGDLDGDGGVDVVVVNRDAPANLYRNVHPQRGHWVHIRALNPHGRPAIGAVITANLGARRITRQVQRAGSYCASSDPGIHIGLGTEPQLRDVHIRWPDGTELVLPHLAPDQIHTIQQDP